ncbi:hypothetical protein [Kineococcus sp. SYSU DK003]|uniref:hypothetical protein n=1 Tax=Kineococcus sp. SYSU DK003 TaxID=3383124 RepID=UPI003D7EA954
MIVVLGLHPDIAMCRTSRALEWASAGEVVPARSRVGGVRRSRVVGREQDAVEKGSQVGEFRTEHVRRL